MPKRAPTACPKPLCPHVKPCPLHARKPWGGQSQAQRTGAPRVPGAMRRAVLERDGYLCQIRWDGCTVKAFAVDHVISVRDGGPTHPDNLRAACTTCNHARGSRDGRRAQVTA